jgi:hypothetical protein
MTRPLDYWGAPMESFEFVANCLHVQSIEPFPTEKVAWISNKLEAGALDTDAKSV